MVLTNGANGRLGPCHSGQLTRVTHPRRDPSRAAPSPLAPLPCRHALHPRDKPDPNGHGLDTTTEDTFES